MNGYSAPAVELPPMLRSADIDKLFGRMPGWFDRDRVRKRLYAKGFPHPVQAGQWSPLAVRAWMETAGANPHAVPPDVTPAPRRHRGRRSRSGYADA